MKTLSILFLSFLVLTSCSDVKKSNQIASIDEMSEKLEGIKAEIEANKVDSSKRISVDARETELRIKNNYFADTIDVKFGVKMDRHKNMRRAMDKLDKMYNNAIVGCNEVIESLRQLKHDIENGDGDRKKYDEFLAFEKSKFEQVEVLSHEYLETKKFAVETYDALFKEIEDFSYQLLNENKKK